ncbi:hypothetical protein [Pontibacter rugosus]|uniref:Uncharacterized protein n=1 Tax=Pontibacter rugosus TaxID=1745966 RepID=A0ABW3SMY2_9BACT
MPLNIKLQKLLEKVYEPQKRYDQRFSKVDISFFTNEQGEPITLFIGKRNEDGSIKGERYVRKIVRKPNSPEILKSHWDLKGSVSHD